MLLKRWVMKTVVWVFKSVIHTCVLIGFLKRMLGKGEKNPNILGNVGKAKKMFYVISVWGGSYQQKLCSKNEK